MRKNNNKGMAIFIVILVILIMSMFVMIFSKISNFETKYTAKTKNIIFAKYIAEAGLNYAIARLQENDYQNRFYKPEHFTAFENIEYLNGKFSFTIEDIKDETTGKLMFIMIISKGEYRGKVAVCSQRVMLADPVPDFD